MTNFGGSRVLEPFLIWSKLDFPLSQLNFLVSEVFVLLIGLVFRQLFQPKPQNTLKRHLITTILGILILYFNFGLTIYHLFIQAALSYLCILVVPSKYIHIALFIVGMGYHLGYRGYYFFKGVFIYELDVSGSLMINTQRITSLGFALYDSTKRENDLTDDQKTQVIQKRPSLIEFLGYIFNFQTAIFGPLCFYNDYIDFITGRNFKKHLVPGKNNQIRYNKLSIIKKCIMLVIVIVAISVFQTSNFAYYKIDNLLNDEMAKRGFLYLIFFTWFACFLERLNFYITWVLADLAANASGFGFNGYDENGYEKWDLLTNINIISYEFATNMHLSLSAWNLGTTRWLRRIAYDRLPILKTLITCLLSSIWHGFYAGYHFMFINIAIAVYAGRRIRKNIRPFFQKYYITRILYDLITTLSTMFALSYSAATFNMNSAQSCIKFYNLMYWCFQTLALLVIILLPNKEKRLKTKMK